MHKRPRYQLRMKDKLRNPHLLALRTVYAEKQTAINDWDIFVASLNKFRGRRFDWTARISDPPNAAVLRWIKESPTISKWASSDTCLVSPTQWPVEVLPAFKHRLIPSPYEITNIDMLYKYAQSERDITTHVTILLYGMGWSVDAISEAYDLSRGDVLRMMYDGVQSWHKIPQYLLWATATDFSRALYPAIIRKAPSRKRGNFITALKKNPFSADAPTCQLMINNPAYFSYLIYGSPKRMRLFKGCRLYRTREARDEQQEKE